MADEAFRGKVCVVTGGASGLGRELGVRLAAAGASVVLADLDEAGLAAAVAAIVAAGGQAKAAPTDVTDSASVQALVEGAVADFGRIDYLFNNAGVVVLGEVRDLSLAQWRRVIEVNLFGVIHGVHHAYPIMIRQGFGHIVNIASGFGMAPGPLNSPYVASKFAVVGASHALAMEARAFGIDVTLVCPGYIRTALIEDLDPVGAAGEAMKAQIPFRLVPVERAAAIILSGVARRRKVVAFPAYVGVLAFLHRNMPGLFAAIGARQIAQFRAIRTAPPA